MKNIKKLLAFTLVLCTFFSATACGKSETEGADTTNAATTESGFTYSIESSTENVETDSTSIQTTASVVTTANHEEETSTKTQPTVEESVSILKAKYGSGTQMQTVFYPSNIKTSGKTYPIIAWANGTGVTNDIYENLLIEFAKGGYIVIANGETMAADGTAQIASIDFLLDESNDPSSLFYKKIDTGKIAVAGHSQGGRSSVNAAVKDSRVGCVLSIAGSNYTYEAEKLSAPTLFFSGSSDMIVLASQWVVPAYNNCKGPAVYACLKNAVHTTCCSNPTAYSEYAVKWFDYWLKNDLQALTFFQNDGVLAKDDKWQNFSCKGI